jgi:hypothetical protein
MSTRRKLEWLILGLTAGLLILLKWLHIGVTHYNIFLLILIGWSLGVIMAFRVMSGPDRSG